MQRTHRTRRKQRQRQNTQHQRFRAALRRTLTFESLDKRELLAADLAVARIDVPPAAELGQTLVVAGRIKNVGNVATPAFEAQILYSRDSHVTPADPVLRTIMLSGLAPGAYHELHESVVVPESLPIGRGRIAIMADSGHVIVEPNRERNNTRLDPIQLVRAKPDLKPTGISGPATALRGERIPVDVSIENLGREDSGAVKYRIVISGDNKISKSDRTLGTFSVSNIGAETAVTETRMVTIPNKLKPREYWLGVIADPANQSKESNEKNNKLPAETGIVISDGTPVISQALGNVVVGVGVDGLPDGTFLTPDDERFSIVETGVDRAVRVDLSQVFTYGETLTAQQTLRVPKADLVPIDVDSDSILIRNTGFRFGIVDITLTAIGENGKAREHTFSVKFLRNHLTERDADFGLHVAADLHRHLFDHFDGQGGSVGKWNRLNKTEALQDALQEILFGTFSHMPTAIGFTEHRGWPGNFTGAYENLERAVGEIDFPWTVFINGVEYTSKNSQGGRHIGAPFEEIEAPYKGKIKDSELIVLNHIAKTRDDNGKVTGKNLEPGRLLNYLTDKYDLGQHRDDVFAVEFNKAIIKKPGKVPGYFKYSLAAWEVLLNEGYDVMPLVSGDRHTKFKGKSLQLPKYLVESSDMHPGFSVFILQPGAKPSEAALREAADSRRGYVVFIDEGIQANAFALDEAGGRAFAADRSLATIAADAPQMGATLNLADVKTFVLALDDVTGAKSFGVEQADDVEVVLRFARPKSPNSPDFPVVEEVLAKTEGDGLYYVDSTDLPVGIQPAWTYFMLRDKQDRAGEPILITSAFKHAAGSESPGDASVVFESSFRSGLQNPMEASSAMLHDPRSESSFEQNVDAALMALTPRELTGRSEFSFSASGQAQRQAEPTESDDEQFWTDVLKLLTTDSAP